jgi:hypothetical protein
MRQGRSKTFRDGVITDLYSDRASDLRITRKEQQMLKKYKITYRAVFMHRTVEIEATSKYDAKQRFYRQYPEAEIVSVEVVEG